MLWVIYKGYEFSGKRFGIVLTYADADPFMSGAVNALRTFQDPSISLERKLWAWSMEAPGRPEKSRRNEALMAEAYELGKKVVFGGIGIFSPPLKMGPPSNDYKNITLVPKVHEDSCDSMVRSFKEVILFMGNREKN